MTFSSSIAEYAVLLLWLIELMLLFDASKSEKIAISKYLLPVLSNQSKEF